MDKKYIGLPWYFIWVKRLFKLAEIVFPPLANYWAWKFFTTPLKFPYPESEKPWYHNAIKKEVRYNNLKCTVYHWGKVGTPKIVLMHGWSSRATQFKNIIEQLVQANYHVIGIDAPAHGKSEGKETDLFGFAGIMKLVCTQEKEVYAIVGHSLGGVAAAINVKNGLFVQRLVIMGSPAVAADILKNFIDRINAYPARAMYLRKFMKKRYKLDFEQATASEIVKDFPPIKTLLIYDKHDHEAPIRHGELLHKQIPTSTLLKTSKLGHTRMLKDVKVGEAILDFLKT
jgi:pimeloyl-ACP methyl ester carboxylesterase